MKQRFFKVFFLSVFIATQGGFVLAYPDPNRQTAWNSFTDKIHTFGQKPQQAKMTLMRLHYQRAVARINSVNRSKHNNLLKKN